MCSFSDLSHTIFAKVGREVNKIKNKILFFFLNPIITELVNKIKLLVPVRELKHSFHGHMVNFVFLRCFILQTFNYCFIHLLKNVTVTYFSSDTVELGRPFKKIIIKSDFIFCRAGYFFNLTDTGKLQFNYGSPN